MPFTLRDVPAVMRKQGWTVGASLMDRWLAGPAWQMSDAIKTGQVPALQVGVGRTDTSDVKMEWALRFARAASAHAQLLLTWRQGPHLTATTGVLQSRVQAWLRARPNAGDRFRFGDLARPVPEIDGACQVNLVRVSSSFFDPIDDFYAALGVASFKLAVAGQAERLAAGRVRVSIDEIGTYVRDTYDFNGEQPLGSWYRDGFAKLAVLAPEIPIDPADADNDGWLGSQRAYSITNATFRKYRARFQRGGDFLVFSDIKRAPLSPPVTVEVDA